jgi:hypothetical protein
VRTPTDPDILSIWEKGYAATSRERGLLLLSSALPDVPGLELLPIGERDARLLQLREKTFGSEIKCATACPRCGEKLDVEFTIPDLLRDRKMRTTDILEMSHEGISMKLRMPNSLDLLSIEQSDPVDSGGRSLFARCVIEATREQVPLLPEDVPESVIDAAGEIISGADPLADMKIRLNCPSCENTWDMTFDITAYFWKEIDTWAMHTLHTVHLLAREYGWTESEILMLSTTRRRSYLDIISAEQGADLG